MGHKSSKGPHILEEYAEYILSHFPVCPTPNCYASIRINCVYLDENSNLSLYLECQKNHCFENIPLDNYIHFLSTLNTSNGENFIILNEKPKCLQHERRFAYFCKECKKELCPDCLFEHNKIEDFSSHFVEKYSDLIPNGEILQKRVDRIIKFILDTTTEKESFRKTSRMNFLKLALTYIVAFNYERPNYYEIISLNFFLNPRIFMMKSSEEKIKLRQIKVIEGPKSKNKELDEVKRIFVLKNQRVALINENSEKNLIKIFNTDSNYAEYETILTNPFKSGASIYSVCELEDDYLVAYGNDLYGSYIKIWKMENKKAIEKQTLTLNYSGYNYCSMHAYRDNMFLTNSSYGYYPDRSSIQIYGKYVDKDKWAMIAYFNNGKEFYYSAYVKPNFFISVNNEWENKNITFTLWDIEDSLSNFEAYKKEKKEILPAGTILTSLKNDTWNFGTKGYYYMPLDEEYNRVLIFVKKYIFEIDIINFQIVSIVQPIRIENSPLCLDNKCMAEISDFNFCFIDNADLTWVDEKISFHFIDPDRTKSVSVLIKTEDGKVIISNDGYTAIYEIVNENKKYKKY